MKISVETLGIRKKVGDFKAIEMIKEAGYDAVDFTYCSIPHDEPILNDEYKDYAYKIKACIEENGLDIVQTHAPFAFEYGQKMDVSEHNYDVVVRSMEASAIIGAEMIVVHAVNTPLDVDNDEYNYQYYKTLEPYAEKFGIKIAVENLPVRDTKRNCYSRERIGSPEKLNAMIDRLGSKWFTGCIDIGHAALTGYEPEEFLLAVKKEYIGCLHVHDNDYKGDMHQMPYVGAFNWDNIMSTLKKQEYNGVFNLELVHCLGKLPEELLFDMMKYGVKVGKHLVGKMEG
ncbi:MAG: sugar phosphate isomerase/epimerase [Clostridia bacterium]|nr:sugar phosphate isomerase/epimerase [Clostridia bacterium]